MALLMMTMTMMMMMVVVVVMMMRMSMTMTLTPNETSISSLCQPLGMEAFVVPCGHQSTVQAGHFYRLSSSNKPWIWGSFRIDQNL